MIGPMCVLAACCFLIGLVPAVVTSVLAKAVSAWAPGLGDVEARLAELAPFDWISVMALVLMAALFVTSLLLWVRLRGSVVDRGPTWGCGYVAPSPRMQYTSSSFAEMLVWLFGWALRPRIHRSLDSALFPQPTDFHSQVNDPVLDEAVLPSFRYAAEKFLWFRIFQQGKIQAYLLYIFVALVALLLW